MLYFLLLGGKGLFSKKCSYLYVIKYCILFIIKYVLYKEKKYVQVQKAGNDYI